jgi:hypothetical protein
MRVWVLACMHACVQDGSELEAFAAAASGEEAEMCPQLFTGWREGFITQELLDIKAGRATLRWSESALTLVSPSAV